MTGRSRARRYGFGTPRLQRFVSVPRSEALRCSAAAPLDLECRNEPLAEPVDPARRQVPGPHEVGDLVEGEVAHVLRTQRLLVPVAVEGRGVVLEPVVAADELVAALQPRVRHAERVGEDQAVHRRRPDGVAGRDLTSDLLGCPRDVDAPHRAGSAAERGERRVVDVLVVGDDAERVLLRDGPVDEAVRQDAGIAQGDRAPLGEMAVEDRAAEAAADGPWDEAVRDRALVGSDESSTPDRRHRLALGSHDGLQHRACTDDVRLLQRCPGHRPAGEPFEERRGDLVAEVQLVGVLPAPPPHLERGHRAGGLSSVGCQGVAARMRSIWTASAVDVARSSRVAMWRRRGVWTLLVSAPCSIVSRTCDAPTEAVTGSRTTSVPPATSTIGRRCRASRCPEGSTSAKTAHVPEVGRPPRRTSGRPSGSRRRSATYGPEACRWLARLATAATAARGSRAARRAFLASADARRSGAVTRHDVEPYTSRSRACAALACA